jgi:8-oxo-dGTP diphosphatase
MAKIYSAVKSLIVEDSKFLIIKQNIGDYSVWDLPGGKIEFGESPYDALKREVKEETDLEIDIVKPIGIWWFFRKTDNDQVVCTTFLCKCKDPNVKLNVAGNEKITEFKWVSKEDFLKNYNVSHQSLKDMISGLEEEILNALQGLKPK